ncbi:hypothetical protein [Gorillibacterium sp. CAU 1737]|uniref:hypothetical protein n=1 Tax=Gorillibacterium sp. CAU 1737 TaxID=3140362 RepID=UPI00325FF6F7
MSESIDTFTSEIPMEQMTLLLRLGKEYSFDPLSSIESEQYFRRLLDHCQGNSSDEQREWLRTIVAKEFEVVDKKPEWIQDPEWPFYDGRPMTFIGQLETKCEIRSVHHSVVFYVFWDPESGTTTTITQ